MNLAKTVVGVAAAAGIAVWGLNNPSSVDSRTKVATETYITQCTTAISRGTERADKAWFTSEKIAILKASYAEAATIQPPPNADPGAVTRMRHVLDEGREYLDVADGEWTWARDITVGFIAGVLDASGGMGIATGSAFGVKSLEMSSDDQDRRDLQAAVQELDRYLADEF